MVRSMEFINAQFKNFKKELSAVVAENKKLKEENECLRQQCTENAQHIKDLAAKLTPCDQYSRRYNLEIKGVAETDSENVLQLVQRVCAVLKEPVLPSDIDACYRVPTRGTEKNIIVQFKSRQQRDRVLEKARKKRIAFGSLHPTGEQGESTNTDGGTGGGVPIYINEHLCHSIKRLLGMAIARKRERFVWTRNGKIFARKHERSALQHILTVADLSKIA
ncbi:hypothetical protein HPB48_014743 [Haemaphysalis longicornis]|uniref:FP protein C-terminal domain-containing protein n=1 Tax=Haemaphysalis longicornis TaxID=44386 RepID=A0A9J6FWE1_HAELO|nr:hypothetical protein HPB48_014743 [Haemaphysalis longicornis]